MEGIVLETCPITGISYRNIFSSMRPLSISNISGWNQKSGAASEPPNLFERTWQRLPDFWKFHLIVWTAYGVGTLPIHVIFLKMSLFWEGSIRSTIAFCLLSCVFSVVATAGLRKYFRRAFPPTMGWLSKLWRIMVLAVLVSVVKTFYFEFLLLRLLDIHLATFLDYASLGLLHFLSLLIHFCLYTSWSLLYLVVKKRHANRLVDQRILRVEHEKMQAELLMLRSQLQPHFLYNALNSMALEAEGNPRLERLIESMSEYLRYGLGNRSETAIRLGDEIDAIANYLVMERERYGDELEVELRIDPASRDIYTSGVLIQPLIENALKYGRITSESPLNVSLDVKLESGLLTIEVANTGSWIIDPDRKKSSGVGMENLKARLELLYPGKHKLQVVTEAGRVLVRLSIHPYASALDSPLNTPPKPASFL